MKIWLKKLVISNALNECKPWFMVEAKGSSGPEELRRFAENAAALDRALRSQAAKPEAPAALHASIMGAVRAASHAPVPEPRIAWLRWIPATAFVVLALVALHLAVRSSPNPVSHPQASAPATFAAAGSALDLGGNLVRESSAAAISPLSDELHHLDSDMTGAEQFLLAAFP